MATELDAAFAARRASKRGGLSPAALLFWALLLLLLGWGGWTAYSAFQTARVRTIAERVIADDGALRGFPVHVGVDDNGASVALLGLVPKPADALDVTRRLREALPASQVTDRTAALPGGLAEARAQIGALSAQVTELAAAGTRSAQATNDALAALTAELKRSREDATRLEARITQSGARSKAQIEALQAEVARLSQPSAAQRLAEWVRTNAIFYDKETDFRDDRTAAAVARRAGRPAEGDERRSCASWGIPTRRAGKRTILPCRSPAPPRSPPSSGGVASPQRS